MKEKPALRDEFIVDRIGDEYGVEVAHLEFLPIGDISSAKYRVATDEGIVYFLKLRRGAFKEISVSVPYFLHQQGIPHLLPPLKTKHGRLWTELDAYTCILYPFIEGQNGFQQPLSEEQWIELGDALKGVHSVNLPPDLQSQIPNETFSPHWRASAKGFLAQAETETFEDPISAEMAACLREHSDEIRLVIGRAEDLAQALQSQPFDHLLCHTDIHAGNLLLDTSGAWYMIDWDDPMLAPKERDLMFIGGGIGGIWNTEGEEASFYLGYGRKEIDLTALTYYRYERIVSDIAEFCQQILPTTEAVADRVRSLGKFFTIFNPHQVLEIALQTDRRLKGE